MNNIASIHIKYSSRHRAQHCPHLILVLDNNNVPRILFCPCTPRGTNATPSPRRSHVRSIPCRKVDIDLISLAFRRPSPRRRSRGARSPRARRSRGLIVRIFDCDHSIRRRGIRTSSSGRSCVSIVSMRGPGCGRCRGLPLPLVLYRDSARTSVELCPSACFAVVLNPVAYIFGRNLWYCGAQDEYGKGKRSGKRRTERVLYRQ